LYADDLVVLTETEDDLNKRLNEWKDNVENVGIRVNMNKTRDYFDATASNWNTSTHSRPLARSFV